MSYINPVVCFLFNQILNNHITLKQETDCRKSLPKTLFHNQFQGRKNGFPSRGTMKHWSVLSATMLEGQLKFLNSRHSRMAKTVTFNLGDSVLIVPALKLDFFPKFSYRGGGGGGGEGILTNEYHNI